MTAQRMPHGGATQRRLLVFGLGYSARAFVRLAMHDFSSIHATTRQSPDSARRTIAPHDDRVRFLDFAKLRSASARKVLDRASHILVSIPPGAKGDPCLNGFADILGQNRREWIGYLSTIGVYGDHGGNWIDERTPCRPRSARACARRAAEEAWRDLARRTGSRLSIFRLAGIYGPGRNVFQRLHKGTARRIIKPGQVFNRIFVTDIARALHRDIHTLPAGREAICNLCDDMPSAPQHVVSFAARLMGIDAPCEIDFARAELSPMARSFYGDNKRVRNALVKSRLGFHFRYPDYFAALSFLWHSQGWATRK